MGEILILICDVRDFNFNYLYGWFKREAEGKDFNYIHGWLKKGGEEF